MVSNGRGTPHHQLDRTRGEGGCDGGRFLLNSEWGCHREGSDEIRLVREQSRIAAEKVHLLKDSSVKISHPLPEIRKR